MYLVFIFLFFRLIYMFIYNGLTYKFLEILKIYNLQLNLLFLK